MRRRTLVLHMAVLMLQACSRGEAAPGIAWTRQALAQACRETPSWFLHPDRAPVLVDRLHEGPGGLTAVADVMAGRLYVLDRSGATVWSAGRQGDGPAEFRAISSIAWWGDSLLLATDPMLRRVSVLRLGGELVTSWPMGAFIGQRVAAGPGGTVLLGGLNGSAGTGALLAQVDTSGGILASGGDPDSVVAGLRPSIMDVVLGTLDGERVFVASVARALLWIGPPDRLESQSLTLPSDQWRDLRPPTEQLITLEDREKSLQSGSRLTAASALDGQRIAFGWRSPWNQREPYAAGVVDLERRSGVLFTGVPGWVASISDSALRIVRHDDSGVVVRNYDCRWPAASGG